ncbi:melanoma-associated antigen B4 [Oryctolagus cuniculus]|uniref:melanoma-associated antigen B4 n=1 Tax=Oryctolagus cuniculus TaxID=9986 RepID=UPI0038790F7A
MPRGQKSKLRARERRRQARSGTQEPKGAQATAAEEAESSSSSSSVVGGTPPSSPASGFPQESQRAPPATVAGAGVSFKRSDKGAKSQGEERENPLRASASSEGSGKDPINRKAGILMQFLLEKYRKKEPIMKAEMLKVVNRRHQEHFPEILRKASERLELVFGLDLKEVNPSNNSYAIVSKLELNDDGSQSTCWGFPRNGLLMPLLAVIFLNNNCAPEEKIWEFLNILGVYDGRKHLIFGEPRKLITKDLVQEEYLEYQQVPNSDPPRYQFLWGPRAYIETSKMKVLEFLAKVNDTIPTAFPLHYEEALRDEEVRGQDRAAARSGNMATASGSSRATPSSSGRRP